MVYLFQPSNCVLVDHFIFLYKDSYRDLHIELFRISSFLTMPKDPIGSLILKQDKRDIDIRVHYPRSVVVRSRVIDLNDKEYLT